MNDIKFKIEDKTLTTYNEEKEHKNHFYDINSINAIYISKTKEATALYPEFGLYMTTDFDEKALVYKTEDELKVVKAYENLIKELKTINAEFKDYFPKCINMKKVQSIGWKKVPFKYLAEVDFGKNSIQFRTTNDEFDKMIGDWRDSKSKDLNI